MASAASSGYLSTTVLFGKGMTPGKLRGLQRISNPNGTLTMVALDQNSSMIEMATKALKSQGQERAPVGAGEQPGCLDPRVDASGHQRIGRHRERRSQRQALAYADPARAAVVGAHHAAIDVPRVDR